MQAIRVALRSCVVALLALSLASCDDDGAGPVVVQIGEVVITIQPTDATAGVALSPAVRVELRDADGNLIGSATDSVTAAIADNPASGTLMGTTKVAAANGVATFSDLSIDKVGAGYTLEVSVGSVTDTSAAFAISAAAAAQVAFASQPTSGTARMTLGSFVVEVQDEFGNRVDGATDDVTVDFGDNPGEMIFHASGHVGPSILQLVDPITPEVLAVIDTTDDGEIFGMTYDPANDRVLAVDISEQLLDIDPVTAARDTIGNFSPLCCLRGLAFEMVGGAGRLLAADVFDNGFYEIDPATGDTTPLGLLTITGDSVLSMNGLALDPTDGTMYGIVKLRDNPSGQDRDLVTVNTTTLEVTSLGTMSENGVSSLAFLADGTLLATTGDGANNPETLWSVDKTDGTMTLVIAMGDGDDGEAIATVPAQLSGTVTVAASNGVASFDDLVINAPANGYTLTATATGLDPGTSAPFNLASP